MRDGSGGVGVSTSNILVTLIGLGQDRVVVCDERQGPVSARTAGVNDRRQIKAVRQHQTPIQYHIR